MYKNFFHKNLSRKTESVDRLDLQILQLLNYRLAVGPLVYDYLLHKLLLGLPLNRTDTKVYGALVIVMYLSSSTHSIPIF
jgi:hypothetical protein